MKEAAGESNMTIITIILIAIVLAIGGIVVRTLMGNAKNKSDNMENTNCTPNASAPGGYDCN